MLSTVPFLMSLLLDRKKVPRAATDELAAVKAAAWAWYQRGPGSEGRLMPEFDLMRTSRTPGPSLFKLEAIRMAEEEAMEGYSQASSTGPMIYTDKSLLDAFEIESISRQLDCLIESSGSKFHRKFVAGDHHDHRQENVTVLLSNHGTKTGKKKKKKKGFWARHAMIACGTREDHVVDARALRDHRQPHEKRTPVVVGLATCRPRDSHA